MSQSTKKEPWRVLQYLIALNDVHNFWLSADKYRTLLREEFLSAKLSFDNFLINNVFLENRDGLMDFRHRIGIYKVVEPWRDKNYPETRAENIAILDSYLTLCEKYQVRPLMFLPPLGERYMKLFSKQKLDEFYYLVCEAQKKHPAAVFFDAWKLNDFSDADFVDESHLNSKGAAKFSSMLNSIILQLENMSLETHVDINY